VKVACRNQYNGLLFAGTWAHTEVEYFGPAILTYIVDCGAHPFGVCSGQRHFSEKRVFRPSGLQTLNSSTLADYQEFEFSRGSSLILGSWFIHRVSLRRHFSFASERLQPRQVGWNLFARTIPFASAFPEIGAGRLLH
jgi:hypothetical protein